MSTLMFHEEIVIDPQTRVGVIVDRWAISVSVETPCHSSVLTLRSRRDAEAIVAALTGAIKVMGGRQ